MTEEKIRTRPFNHGHEKEGSWPPLQGKGGTGFYHRDPETGEFKEGFPPPKIRKFGQAPYVIQDTIDAYYHPGAEQWTESRSGLEHLDNASGCITTDKMLPADPSNQRRANAERKADAHKALHEAVARVDNGTAPLTEETRQLCEKQNEIVSNALGMDAFNAVGRISNAKGKRYKEKYGKRGKSKPAGDTGGDRAAGGGSTDTGGSTGGGDRGVKPS